MSIDPIFWLLAAVGFLALEGMTFSMVSVWFAAGSAAALLCCLFTHSFRVQAVVFIAVSAVCLLAFKLLVKSRLLPLLIWCGLGWKLYPQWANAHPVIFYGVLAFLALVIVFSWLGPYLERRREEKRFENHVRSEAIRARAEGRTISGFKVENGVPVTIWRD